jgi:predicted DNA-binding protein
MAAQRLTALVTELKKGEASLLQQIAEITGLEEMVDALRANVVQQAVQQGRETVRDGAAALSSPHFTFFFDKVWLALGFFSLSHKNKH